MRFRFRFRLIPFVATAVVVAIGCSLGQWQLRRAAEKQAIEATLTARGSAPLLDLNVGAAMIADVEYRQVSVKGEFVTDWPVYLDNRPYKGTPGFYVLMPLRIDGTGSHVLVERGWIAREMSDRTKIPVIPTPSGLVEIRGTARSNPGHVMQLGQPEKLRAGSIVQNVGIAELAAGSKLAFRPFLIEQANDTGDNLVRDWPRPSSGVDKHYGYAFQWYALAGTAFIFFLVTGFRRERS